MNARTNDRLDGFLMRVDHALQTIERARAELPKDGPEWLPECYQMLTQHLAELQEGALAGQLSGLLPARGGVRPGLAIHKWVGEWCENDSVSNVVASLDEFYRDEVNPAKQVDRALKQVFRTESPDDYRELFLSMLGSHVYFSYAELEGDPAVAVVSLAGGERVVFLFTSPDDEHLTRHYARVPWEGALRMIVNMPEVDGLVIQNKREERVAIDRGAVEALFSAYVEPRP